MSFLTWLRDKFDSGTIPISGDNMTTYAAEYAALAGDVYIREMAFWSATNLVANAISKCEFKTFTNSKETKGKEYYLWNIEPNRNQNSSQFIHKWISQLYSGKDGCLIIEVSGQLLVADTFMRTPYALYDDVFTQVTVGDFTFNRSFKQSEVLYFKLTEHDMSGIVAGLFDGYSKLLTYSMKAFQRSKGTKGTFNYKSIPVAGTEERKAFDALMQEKFKAYLEADNAVLPMGDGQAFTESTQRTYASETSRDIRALIDDVSDFTAKALGIPPALLRGDVQGVSDALDNFLTFCVDPLTDMLAEEINRKRNGWDGFSKGTYLKIDTKQVKHIDLLSVSTAIDKLISSGVFCANNILELVGEQPIDEDWAKQHWITKNYMRVEDMMALLDQGGTG